MYHMNAIINGVRRIQRFNPQIFPDHYARSGDFGVGSYSTATGRRSLVTPVEMSLLLGKSPITVSASTIDLNLVENWDSITLTNFSVAANRAGKDFFLYASKNKLILSANSTVPTGYTAATSRKVGGFHCLCANAGTFAQNATHPLTGFLLGDITPLSIWDILHRPSGICSPSGMVFEPKLDLWGDIYHQSGTGTNTKSAFGATITDTRTYWDHAEDLAAVGKRMFLDNEFSVFAKGSREQVNIFGSADPVVTGGFLNTVSEAILAENGAWGCFGEMYCWVDGGHAYRNDDAAYAGGWSWKSTGNRGQQYTQGANGAVGLLAGGSWELGSNCGSRCRAAAYARAYSYSNRGSRGCARRQA